MVTSVVEGGQQKCEQYWPSQETQEYGPFKVTLTDQQVFADYTIRQLLVAVSVVATILLRHNYIGSVVTSCQQSTCVSCVLAMNLPALSTPTV